MIILKDLRYRCALCGEPMLRDGGNRLEAGQLSHAVLCMNGVEREEFAGGRCPNFGIRLKAPLEYVEADQA